MFARTTKFAPICYSFSMTNIDQLTYDFQYQLKDGVNFIEIAWYYLSPFSAHEVKLDGGVYKTAEHAYQALRMLPEVQAEVLASRSPMDAWRKAQKLKRAGKIDPNCDKYHLMERIFRAKLEQHPDIRKVLVDSGDTELHKVYDTDYYWGTGVDGTGQNLMGKLWMKLRDELQ